MKVTCLAAVFSIAMVLSVNAQASPSPQGATASVIPAELSAARKKVRRKPYVVDSRSPYYRRPGVAPSFGYIGPPGYAGEYA